MKFTEHSLTINGLKTFYIEAGEGIPLIFIHGWGARSYSYKDALTLLAKKYHIIALDLPGFGRSATPQKMWNFGNYAEFVSLFINQVTQGEVVLAGHSLGGGVALYTAALNKKITELILIDAVGIPFERRRIELYTLFMLRLFQEMLHPKYWIKDIDLFFNFMLNASHFIYLIPFTQKIFNRKIATDPAVFNNIHAKTSLLWGKKDTIFGKGIELKLTKCIPNAKLEYINGTHNWIVFNPEHILEYL